MWTEKRLFMTFQKLYKPFTVETKQEYAPLLYTPTGEGYPATVQPFMQ